MFKKIIRIIGNYYKTVKLKENIIMFIFLAIVSGLILFNEKNIPVNDLNKYVLNINDASLSVVSLLVAFGVAVVTLLYTSSSPSIQRAKEYYPEGLRNCNNIPINYYQLLITRIYYTLIIQILMMFINIFVKIFLFQSCSIILVCIISILLLHIIIIELKVVISMYHLMWRD